MVIGTYLAIDIQEALEEPATDERLILLDLGTTRCLGDPIKATLPGEFSLLKDAVTLLVPPLKRTERARRN